MKEAIVMFRITLLTVATLLAFAGIHLLARWDRRTHAACAAGVMRDFYPRAVFCDEAVFRYGGWQACFRQ